MKRKQYLTRWGALKTERASWDSHWMEISDYLLPRSGRFQPTDRNKGDKRHNDIIDSTGTRALRILAAGMMSGMTSPARPWFRLATSDQDMMEYEPVKLWLNDVTLRMRNVFSRSNLYRALHGMYEELGAFGTASSLILPREDKTIHAHLLTCGEYAIATDAYDDVRTCYREFQMTVSQMVREFGLENCSRMVQNLYKQGKGLEDWVTIIHVIEPRYDRDYTKRDNLNMPFKSCYFEQGGTGDKILRESGFKSFPAVAPRWMVTGSDVYGLAPAMEALGDVKQLQHEQLRKAEAIDYLTRPPMEAPVNAKYADINRLPGGISYTGTPGQQNLRSVMEVRMDLGALLEDIRDVRERINSAFYADLFLMLANDNRSGITATEVAERHEEKLLMLGPVLERLHNELLDPLIDLTFERLLASGMLPPPPEELQGMDLQVEFVSTLAQAQRAVGVASVDRLLGMVGAVAGMKPEIVDKLNTDQIVDAYGDMLGVDPNLIMADDKVALIREDRAQQMQLQQQAAAMPAMAQTAKVLADTKATEDSALAGVLSGLQGYGEV